jgi:Flp pilus assembly protein TadG
MSHRPIGGLARARDGATAVEFALVIGPFLLILFGVIEFGRMLWTLNALQETAIAGARCMGVQNSACASGGSYSATGAASYVQQVASGWGIGLTSANVALNNSASCGGAPGFSQATITYHFQTVVPMLTSLINDPMSVSACFPNQA